LNRAAEVSNSLAAGVSRRQEYAETTRKAILGAARRLFSERGYFSTKVDEIAALARVAPATVYAVAGGKQGLLRSIVEIWTDAPIITITLSRIEELDDPVAILRLVAATARSMREEFGDIIRLLLATAPHDKAVSDSLAIATSHYRRVFVSTAQHLSRLGSLHAEMDVDRTVDVLWFYFGYSGLFTLHDENGWTYERAEQWLCDQATHAILQKPTLPSRIAELQH
jgi:AcrR family transcriptional regulator